MMISTWRPFQQESADYFNLDIECIPRRRTGIAKVPTVPSYISLVFMQYSLFASNRIMTRKKRPRLSLPPSPRFASPHAPEDIAAAPSEKQ